MHLPLEKVWARLTGELLRRLGPDRYAVLIRHARPVLLDEEEFLFHCADASVKDKIETLMKPAVTEAARRVTNRNVHIRFSVEGASFGVSDRPSARGGAEETPARGFRLPALTFRAFVTGRGNRMALQAARAFAGKERPVYRTLLLHAPSGLGKTHLLRAIGAELSSRPGLSVLHFTGPQFHRQFAWAHQKGCVETFLNKCRSAQALLFDDLHLLSEKMETQAALLSTVLALEERGSRVALTSERPPRALEGFSGSVKARLRADMEVAIERPDTATSLEFLKGCAPPETPLAALEYVAIHVRSSHKDQIHCLRRLLERRPITVGAARAVVGEFLNQWSRGLTYEDIARAAADRFGVPVDEIYSPRRTRPAADARQACFYLARKLLRHPFAHIGRHFGGRDHATVLQACKKLEGASGDRLRKMERELASFVVGG